MTKTFKNFTLIFTSLLLISCESQKSGEFELLPLPQKFEINGSSSLNVENLKNYYSPQKIDLSIHNDFIQKLNFRDSRDESQIECIIDNSLDIKAEGYLLEITKDKITLKAKDDAGLFYAFKTLEQLVEDSDDQNVNLPICKIKDYPQLAYRAIHLDIKHHLEKLDYYYELLNWLARYKVNAIIVEMEDKVKYERQPLVGSADALSIKEWKDLSNYAKNRNIEISPLIQGLGHASFILKHNKYKKLRDDPKSDWAFNPLNPKTYEVQFDLYKDAIDATPHGKYLHIGGDEVHTTGRGSGKSALELQLIWLNKVCKFADENGRIPIFWDDMPLKLAGVYSAMFDLKLTQEEVDKIWEENEYKLIKFLDQFPKNCIYMRWNYSSPQAIGNIKAMEWFMNNEMQVLGATAGQTRWVLMPQNESNIDNIKSFASSSIKNNLNGLLLTLWDDDSPHFELYKRGITAFAEYTWTGAIRPKQKIKKAYRHREFSINLVSMEHSFIDSLEGPVSSWKNILLKNHDRNRLRKLEYPIVDAVIDLPEKTNKGKWIEKYSDKIQRAEESLKKCKLIDAKINVNKSLTKRNIYSLEVYEQVNALVKFSAISILLLRDYDSANSENESEIINNIKQLPAEFKILRKKFEEIYSKSRNLVKPPNYILDQDHHVHLANQSISFDWQFFAEILFLQKLENKFITL